MKNFIGVQLAIFFVTASLLYLYASSVFGASTIEQKSMYIDMTARESYDIWKAVNELEDLWLPETTEETKTWLPGELQQAENVKNKASSLAKRLMLTVRPYEALTYEVKRLLIAYKNHEIQSFLNQKKRIGELLAPIWREAIVDAREKKQRRKAKMGWGEWFVEKIKTSMNNLYSYLVGTTKTKTKLVGEYDEKAGTYKVTTVEQEQ